jgi:hypothetical protein
MAIWCSRRRLRCGRRSGGPSARVEVGEPRLLEVNPNPAWTNDGKLAFMAGFAGVAYPDMLKMILDAALTRLGLR